MTIGRRQRFYKKVVLTADNIAPNEDKWKGNDGPALKLEFPTNLTTIVISNDDEDHCIEYSFNGSDLDGELTCDDGPFSQDCASEGYLYLRLPVGTTLGVDEEIQVRVWAWRGGTGR